MNFYFFFIISWLISVASPFAQSEYHLETTQDSLIWYADIMHNASIDKHRTIAQEHFNTILATSLLTDREFQKEFSTGPGFKVVYSPDSSLRIATWQLIDSTGKGNFYGYFQLKGEEPIKFTDVSQKRDIASREVAGEENWPGVVYSQIIAYGKPQDSTYILLGSGIINNMQWKHIAESFRVKNKRPVFGVKAFHKANKTYDREILVFSAGSGVSLHYLEGKNLIIFDELQTVFDPHSFYQSYVPSGFYNGYVLKNGSWKFVEDVKP